MTISDNIVAKLAVAFVAVAMAFSLVAPAAKAQDVSSMSLQQLIQLVNQLQAQLAGQTGGTAGSCSYTFTRSLSQGSTGADVMNLQKFLNMSADTQVAAAGAAGGPGSETSFYGPATAAAVSKFQTKYSADILVPSGLTSPTGFFGPASMAKANALCASGSTGGSTGGSASGPLKGGAGSLTDIKLVSGLSNEEVGEGASDVEVMGLEFKADGSDVEITAVNVDFDRGSGVTGNFDRYAEEVSIWLDGEVYARVDARDFTRSNNFGRTVTLDRGAIVREGRTAQLVVAVSGVRNLDSARVGDKWDAGIDSVRFRDALGASITETMSGNNQTSTVGTFEREFSFEDFATSANLKVSVRAGDSSINNARTIEVSSTTNTTNVDVFSFGVRVEGNSDVLVDEIEVTATTTNALLGDVISAAYLYLDGDRVGSKSIAVGASATAILFDDLDLELGGGTHDFVVKVDVRRANGTNGFVSGSTITGSITSGNPNWYIEDENGDEIAAADFSGTATGDAHKLVTEGLSLNMKSSSTTAQNNATTPSASYGEFRMTVEVTAIGETLYVPQTAARNASSTVGAAFEMQDANGNAYTNGTTTQSFTRTSGGTVEGSGRVRIDEGQTATFELYVTLDPDAAAQYRAQLLTVGFNDTNAVPDTTASATPATDFRTAPLQIQN